MSDKLVTHEDLPILRDLRDNGWTGSDRIQAIIADLIAAAEADQPPLPEPTEFGAMVKDCRGRVFIRTAEQSSVWRQTALNSDGRRYLIPDARFCEWSEIEQPQLLTPLRPTVTEADVERAARAAHEREHLASWDALHAGTRETIRADVRAAFEAAGIEVRDV